MARISELPATSDPLTLDDLVEGERDATGASQQWTVGQLADALLDGAWTAPALLNAWTDFGAGEQVAQFRKVHDIVYLRGLIKGGATASVCLQLPVGFRPPATVYCSLIEATATPVIALARINTDGTIVVYGASRTAISLTMQFSTTP